MGNKITIMTEEFENEQTGETVQGVTIIIDGKLKQVIERIYQENSNYNSHTEIIRDALLEGLKQMVSK